MSMSDQSKTWTQLTLWDMTDVISSQGLLGGTTPCSLPDGPTMSPCGQAPVHASPIPSQAKAKGTRTKETSGPTSFDLSKHASLNTSLANKLRELLPTDGLMEYVQTWTEKATPAGLRYWAHTASAPRTSGNACTGWPTPKAGDTNDQGSDRPMTEGGRIISKNGTTVSADLTVVTQLVGWPTPRSQEPGKTSEGYGECLAGAAKLVGWATPTTRDHKDTGDLSESMTRQDGKTRNDTVPRQAFGIVMEPSHAGMEGSEESPQAKQALNPAFSLWLMGFPPMWAECGIRSCLSTRSRKLKSKGGQRS